MRFGCIQSLLLGGAILLTGAGCTGSGSSPGPGEEGAALSAAPPPRVAFADVTTEAGLAGFQHHNGGVGDLWFPEEMGGGAGFLDYDGDGWLDVALVAGGAFPAHGASAVEAAGPALRLFRNQGNPGSGPGQAPRFEEVTDQAGLGDLRAYALGLASADYDNDGDVDVLVTTLGQDVLLGNRGDGTYEEVTEQAGLGGVAQWSSSALFFDAEGDGDADLYVGGYVDWTPEKDVWCTLDGQVKEYCSPNVYTGIPSRFYRNNGDGTFTDESERLGFLEEKGKSLGIAELDYDQDGRPDFVVANDGEPDLLYHNEGGGRFAEVGVASGIAFGEDGAARAGMGIDAGVLEAGGAESVVVGNFSHEMVGVYRHLGGGLFLDRAAASKIGHRTLLKLTFGLFLFDVELDGDLDLFAANGHVYPSVEQTKDRVTYRQPPQLFLNRGDGTFDEHPSEDVWAAPLLGRGAAWGDYDRDGDTDVLVAQNGGPCRLLSNQTTGRGGVVRVRLRGRGGPGGSQREGLSSRVVAVLSDGRRVASRVRGGSSYLSQSEAVAVVGLGRSSVVDTLEVWWSGGVVERVVGVVGDREVVIAEGRGVVEEIPLPVQNSIAAEIH